MSEVEKMYENAGIEPTYTDECHMADSYYSMAKDLNERGILFDDYMKQECPYKNEVCYETCPYAYNKEFYPPFTAEKQLELIKWLGHRRHIDINIYNIKGCTIYDISNDYDCILNEHKFMFDSNTFEDALAGLINQVWYSLTEEEKQQVKGILE